MRQQTRQRFGIAVIGAVLVLATGSCGVRHTPPNIILVLADDLGWTDLGVTGSHFYRTPHIDRLATQGLSFRDAYANAPNCAPSRASLLTGRYTPRHGIYTVGTSERGNAEDRRLIPTPNTTTLDTTFVTLAEILQDLGYRTGHFGKWHLGGSGALPEEQGFDVNVGGSHRGHPESFFFPYGEGTARIPHLGQNGKPGDYLTGRLTDAALDFIRTNEANPFFLYLPHYTVHVPIEAPDSLVERYQGLPADSLHNNVVYAAMIHTLDTSVGRIVALVDSLGIAKNTTIIFFSDNGGHGAITSNLPLRGAKGMLYEGGIRVPLIVKSRYVTEPGTTTDVPVIGLDLFPTLIELAGGNPEVYANDGASLLPLLRGKGATSREALYWHFPAYLEAYKGGLSAGPWRTTPSGAIRANEWKLIERFEDGTVELYNLKQDPGESNDLSSEFPDTADSLLEMLRSWRVSTQAPVPATPNPEYRSESAETTSTK